MYLDSAYIVKFYLNEPDSSAVRALIARADSLVSSGWALTEVACAFQRKLRERRLDTAEYQELLRAFRAHTEERLWEFIPITDRVFSRLTAVLNVAPPTSYIRAGDALHLATASDLGETEIWSNDRHLLAAAPLFGLMGRSA
jgi:predicted nucleic acid-binding protein